MIAIVQTIVTLIALAVRVRTGLAVLIFFMAFGPRSLGVSLAGGGLSLPFLRLTLPVMVGMFSLAVLVNEGPTNARRQGLLRNRIFCLLSLLAVAKVVSCGVNRVSPLYAIEDGLMTLGIFWIFTAYGSDAVLKSVSTALILAALMYLAILPLEAILGQPVHFRFGARSILDKSELSVRIRDGVVRFQGVFDNPLQFAEYIVYSLPLLLYRRGRLSRGLARGFLSALIAILFFEIFLTGSRGGLIAAVGTVLTYGAVFLVNRGGGMVRLLLPVGLAICAITLIVLIGPEITDFYRSAIKTDSLGAIYSKADRSLVSRALQFYEVGRLAQDSYWFGVGAQQNFSTLGSLISLDNYFLRVFLEAGSIGVVIFVSTLFAATRSLKFPGPKSSAVIPDYYLALQAAGLSLLVGFVLMKCTLSQPYQNVMFYGLFALISGQLVRRAPCPGRQAGDVRGGSREVIRNVEPLLKPARVGKSTTSAPA